MQIFIIKTDVLYDLFKNYIKNYGCPKMRFAQSLFEKIIISNNFLSF